MRMNRRAFVTTLGSAFAAPRLLPQGSAAKAYGSGYFGEWIGDEFGLPAFRYTCDQVHDPKAVTAVRPGILSTTDHVHQVGNDRLVAQVSNYGVVQVRQDEGAPKFLNDVDPGRSQYGGGIGYLVGAKEVLSTYYSGNPKTFDRLFGVGYLRKRVEGSVYSVDQIITAPFGDDPVLLSQVTVTNRGDAPADLRWIEYWGCQPYQFSFRSFMQSFGGAAMSEGRRKLSDRFAHDFRALGSTGLMETKRFLGRLPEDDAAWEKIKENLATRPNPFLGPVQETTPEAAFDDLEPPPTFLVSLDAPASGFATNGRRFFGEGGAAKPAGLEQPLDGDLNSHGSSCGMFLERKFTLKPRERRTLYFLYGYLPKGASTDPLMTKYRTGAADVWAGSSKQWKASGLHFDTPGEPWVARESAWNYYYVRSSLTYDDYFGEHIVSQGAIYQYQMGFQGAARDPLQHALPFLFSDPRLLKEVLRYTLKEVRKDGSIPYGIVGHGQVMPAASDRSSDIPMWMLWTASEYVLATRDTAFLDEQIPTGLTDLRSTERKPASVRALLARCYRHMVDDVGTGEHGVMKMLEDDWNDALVTAWAQRVRKECVERGESVLNSAMAAYVFDYYARMLAFTGDEAGAAPIRQKADEHRKAARSQWTGQWLRRAWLGPTLGWVGEKGLWLEPQPWAVIGGITLPYQSIALMRTVDEVLRRPSPIGCAQLNKSPDMLPGGVCAPGEAINGGVWPSLNQTLIWALAMVDPKMAWDEWRKNSFARHAEVYPDIWYNTWSGGDTLNSTLSAHPGETVSTGFLHYTDYPVFNVHSHACSLYSLVKLLGVDFTADGLRVAPSLPVATYRFDSPLLGVAKTPAGYEGWYTPLRAGSWTIRVSLPPEEANRVKKGERGPDGAFVIKGASAPGKPMRWSLRVARG